VLPIPVSCDPWFMPIVDFPAHCPAARVLLVGAGQDLSPTPQQKKGLAYPPKSFGRGAW